MSKTDFLVNEKFLRYDSAGVSRSIEEYLGGEYEIVDPRLAKMARVGFDQFEAANGWFLSVQSGERQWVVDMFTSNETLLGDKSLGFREWAHDFGPKNCNDWLALPQLYRLYVRTGQIPQPLVVSPTTFLEKILRPTRGLLHWTSQLEELIDVALSDQSSTSAVKRLATGYRRQCQRTLEELDQLVIEGQSLRTVLYHHTHGLKYFFGGPNHFISGFLSEHFFEFHA